MAYCKRFIAGINQINFSEKPAKIIYHSLMVVAYKQLREAHENISKKIASLPKELEYNEQNNQRLEAYKEEQARLLAEIDEQINEVKNTARSSDINLNKENDINEEFVKHFAVNFRNIRHLSDTLSDAPTVIKNLQTALYIEVLFKISQKEQEEQVQTLALVNIQDMIAEAIKVYDTTEDEQLRQQCHFLVQLGLFELIRRECDKVPETPDNNAQYQQYQAFIISLCSKVPDVKDSTILDDLSQFQSIEGKSIHDLLAHVEKKFHLSDDNDWEKDEKIQATIQRKTLFNKLRFGQEERRAYGAKFF